MSMAVVMTAFKRAGYLAETMESWQGVRGLQTVPCRVALEPSGYEDLMTGIAHQYWWDVRCNESRLGVLVNPVEAISAMFRDLPGVDFVILAEEDVRVSSDLLEFFTWAQRFRGDQSVTTVNAHRPQGTTVQHPRMDAALMVLGFSCPLIWGTWRDRWESLIEPTWDRDYRANGWDWNLTALTKAAGKFSVIPERNRSDHIGENDGAHCTPGMFPATVSADFVAEIEPQSYQLVDRPGDNPERE